MRPRKARVCDQLNEALGAAAPLKSEPESERNSIFARLVVVGMNVPPSWHARGVRVVCRSKLLQMWFVKYTCCECDGGSIVDSADSGATGAAKGSTRV